jgi:hypothetical protein
VSTGGQDARVVAADDAAATAISDKGSPTGELPDDDATDARLEQVDDGSSAVAGAEALVGGPQALPFEMPVRERFAALPGIEATGDARVDAATARLDEIPDLPTADHVGVYTDVHHRLQDALSDTEVR